MGCVYHRPESTAANDQRHPARIAARAAADRDGRAFAMRFHGDFDTGAYASWPHRRDPRAGPCAGTYRVAAVHRHECRHSHQRPTSGAFRFGVLQAAIAHEALMDGSLTGSAWTACNSAS
ncbi:MAG: molybdopterin cofactor-binding domain-containing protein [Geminicoccaceae bacterium]